MRDRAAPWLITHHGGKKAASGEAWGKNLGVARKMMEGILMRNNLCYNREAVVWRVVIEAFNQRRSNRGRSRAS